MGGKENIQNKDKRERGKREKIGEKKREVATKEFPTGLTTNLLYFIPGLSKNRKKRFYTKGYAKKQTNPKKTKLTKKRMKTKTTTNPPFTVPGVRAAQRPFEDICK